MKKILILLISLSISQFSISQNKKSKEVKSELAKINLSGLKFRSVGPALTAGRIADIAVNKNNPKIYYVAVASEDFGRLKIVEILLNLFSIMKDHTVLVV